MSESVEQKSPELRRITLGSLLGWGWSILVGLPGVMAVVKEDNASAGVLFILSALAACPWAARKLEKTASISLSGWLRFVLAFGFAFAAGSVIADQKHSPTVMGLDSLPQTRSANNEKVLEAKVLLDLTGSGTKSTEKFTTQADDWNLEWSYDCSNFGYQGNFMVDIEDKSSFSGLSSVNQLGSKGTDVEHYHRGGTFYLTVNSECRWHIRVLG